MATLILVLGPPILVLSPTFLVLCGTFILVPPIFTPFDFSRWTVHIFSNHSKISRHYI
jgi:hypothetical protein